MKKLIINYKAYAEGVDEGKNIAEISKKLADETSVDILVVPPFTVLKETSDITRTLSQGVNAADTGAFTGHVSAYEISKSGAVGVLLNHSENRITEPGKKEIAYQELGKIIESCKKKNLETYVCVQNIEEARKVTGLEPTAIAYEPPELIGGNISVSKSKPEIVKEFCDLIKGNSKAFPLIGAGIKTNEDVKKSVELGSEGILVASGIMKAKEFRASILELADPLRD